MWCEFDDGFELVLLMLPLWPFYTNGERGAIVCLREEEEEEGSDPDSNHIGPRSTSSKQYSRQGGLVDRLRSQAPAGY